VTVVVGDEREVDDTPIDLDRWAHLAEAVLAATDAQGELTLTFVDDDEIASLNEEHMGKAGPTDVLAFPIDEVPTPGVPRLLGDVVVCPAVAAGQSAEHAGTFDDEIALLVVHGILHVLGHDHAEADEAEAMRQRELELLQTHHWGGAAPIGFRQSQE
jgi:probable rRNA maturation factor